MSKTAARLLWLAILLATALEIRTQPRPDACEAPERVAASALTLVGELHGNVESPAWVGSVACALARSGEVVVALEMSRSEQHRISMFMRSAGAPSDQSALVAGPFWRGQDGRASEAVVSLLERLRRMAAAGASVSVTAIDDWKNPAGRDAAMASALRELRTVRPDARVIALMGNLHARSNPREPSKGPDDHPVGYLLRDLKPLSVLVEYSGGFTWACAPKCGPFVLGSPKGGERAPGSFSEAPSRPGYHASVSVGHGTLSPPVSQRSP
jgi:hypothetical protein